jgi:3-phosphoshikimate 1-carboxyvinyltransferase
LTADEPRDQVVRPARRVHGVVRVPGDKSISHRALILGALASGETRVAGLAPGLDVQSTARCLLALGAAIEPRRDGVVRVRGGGFGALRSPGKPLDCGNSGTTARLLAGVLAACDLEAELTGDDSLRRRPMRRVAEPLRRMGAEVAGETLPLRVRGTARPRALRHELEVASAQVKSAILLAGLRADGATVVREPARSRDHTERMLRLFGADVLEDDRAVTLAGPIELEAADIDVPGDLSSAAFFACAAAALPGSRLVLRDVGVNPLRTGILDVLREMGVTVRAVEERDLGFEPCADLVVAAPEKLAPARVAGPLVPRLIDELVVLAVLATRAHGVSEFRDAAELRVKESDRIAVVAEGLAAMGAAVEGLPDGLRIEGPCALRGAAIDPRGDHRIAMAFAVAGLFAAGETRIADPGCAAVSYPDFFRDLESVAERT